MSIRNDNLRKRTGAAAAAAATASGEGEPTETKASGAEANDAADYKSGTNWVHGGGIEANPYLFVLIVVSPFLSLLLPPPLKPLVSYSNLAFASESFRIPWWPSSPPS